MEKTSKKFWIITLTVPLTIIGMFIGYLIITYANKYVQTNYGAKTVSEVPSYDPTSSSYYGGVGMDSVKNSYIRNTTQEIIKTASMNLAADDMDKTLASIEALETTYNASTTNLQDSGKGAERYLYLTIKVEESKFEELYNKLKALPGEFTYSSIGSSDVTESVMDLESRLANLQKLETQLNDILKSAKTVDEILSVQKELSTTRTDIEAIQTQLKNIDNQTSYSYITITISQSSTGTQLSDNEWRPIGILKEAGRALVGFAKFLGTGLIYVLVFSPVIAAVVVPVVLILKKTKK
jgi:hypothetical protein